MDPHDKRSGLTRVDAPTTMVPPQTLTQSTIQTNPHIESLTPVSNQRRPTSNDLGDQEMSEPLEPPARLKSKTQPEAKQPIAKGRTPNAKLHFGIPGLTGTQTQAPEVNANPFVSSSEGNREAEQHSWPPRGSNKRLVLLREKEAHSQTGLAQTGSTSVPLPHPEMGSHARREERTNAL
jgi:hypothetical protein